MVRICVFSAFILALLWLGYIFKIFLCETILVHIFMPIVIVMFLSTLILQKTKFISHPGFKYVILYGFLFAICILNVALPRHVLLGYALLVALTNHYYSKPLGRRIFIITLIAMLVCLYLGMFVGEYDPHLLTEGKVLYDENLGDYVIYQPESTKERFDFMIELLHQGNNRFLRCFVYYYLPRAAALTLVFFVCYSLQGRTFKLLEKESEMRVENNRIETELRFAHDMQMNSLPQPFQNTEDVEILANLTPAREVGGDFYNYIMLDDTHVGIVIGDVSGKGAPAALIMMKTLACFQTIVRMGKSPAATLGEVNKTICENNESSTFVTCFYAVLDTKTGILTYANAGHNPPIIKTAKRTFYVPVTQGLVLGAAEIAVYKDEMLRLNKGDLVALYTDGVTEARNALGAFFGEKQLLSFFEKEDYSSLFQIHRDLQDRIFDFIGKEEQFDDLTYLLLQYQGDRVYIRHMTFDAKMQEMDRVCDFLREQAKEVGLEQSVVKELLLVVDEIFSNIAKYAYEGEQGEVYFRFQFNRDKNEVILTFIDHGVEFNQLGVEDKPLSPEDFQQRAEGGLGILMVKKMMDETSYSHLGSKNIVTLKKKLS